MVVSFCSDCSQPSSGPNTVSGIIRWFMCILICGCSWKAHSLAGLLLLPATSRCCRSCPGIPESAAAGWLRCSVRWRNGHRRSRGRSKSEDIYGLKVKTTSLSVCVFSSLKAFFFYQWFWPFDGSRWSRKHNIDIKSLCEFVRVDILANSLFTTSAFILSPVSGHRTNLKPIFTFALFLVFGTL